MVYSSQKATKKTKSLLWFAYIINISNDRLKNIITAGYLVDIKKISVRYPVVCMMVFKYQTLMVAISVFLAF